MRRAGLHRMARSVVLDGVPGLRRRGVDRHLEAVRLHFRRGRGGPPVTLAWREPEPGAGCCRPANISSWGAAREIVERLNDPATGDRYRRWVERARGCRHPVRLRGSFLDADVQTGEVVREFSTAGEPDGVLLKPCGNRRAHMCPPCSEVYRGDAWQLVAAGAQRWQGSARERRRAPARVRHLHGAELRPGAHRPRARRPAAGLPAAEPRGDVPARALARVLEASRRR